MEPNNQEQYEQYIRKLKLRKLKRKIRQGVYTLAAVLLLVVGYWAVTQLEKDTPDVPHQPSFGPGETQEETQEEEESGPHQVIPADQLELPEWIVEAYLTPNRYSRPQTKLKAVNGVVVHYVGNPGTTGWQNRSYYENQATTGETYVSSNFIIGLDGTVILCVPLDEVAYASNHRNNDTISIECCHPDANGSFTQATYQSLIRLVAWLRDTYGLKQEEIIRHYDVTGKICPKYYVDNPDAWQRFLRAVANATGK